MKKVTNLTKDRYYLLYITHHTTSTFPRKRVLLFKTFNNHNNRVNKSFLMCYLLHDSSNTFSVNEIRSIKFRSSSTHTRVLYEYESYEQLMEEI